MSQPTKPPFFGGWGGWKFPGPGETLWLLLAYWAKVLAELASKWFPMLSGEYPRTWFVFEFLMLNLGLATAIQNYRTAIWIPALGYLFGFITYWAHRNFMPWLFTLCQGIHAFGAGTAVGMIIEFLGMLGLKLPKNMVGGAIITAGDEKLSRKELRMQVVRDMKPSARIGNTVQAIIGIAVLAFVAYIWPAYLGLLQITLPVLAVLMVGSAILRHTPRARLISLTAMAAIAAATPWIIGLMLQRAG